MSRVPSMSNSRARRLCRALGWAASEWAAHARGLLSAVRDWPWRVRVKVLVADLAPHDGAGYCVEGLFPSPYVQFRAVGRGHCAKGALLPVGLATLTGVRVPRGVQAVLAPEQFKGQTKPGVGQVVEMTILARPLVQGRQAFSWQALLFLWAAMESREEKEALWGALLETLHTEVGGLLEAVSEALKGNLLPLTSKTEAVDLPLLEALKVFGVTKETAGTLTTWAVHQVADLIRSSGLVGKRLLLVMSERGATFTRDQADLVVVRTPVRRPQGVATVKLTPEARAALRRGVMLLHPSAAKEMDGDDDGDFVAVFSQEWLVRACERLARLDPLFQDAVKGEKKRRVLGLSDEDFQTARALAEESSIGLATLTLFHRVVCRDWKGAAFWSQQLQLEVDSLKWDVSPVREGYDCAPFGWRRTPESLADFHKVTPLGKGDVVGFLWNHTLPLIQAVAQAISQVEGLAPIDYLAHLRAELMPPDKGLVAKANALAEEWSADWNLLRLLGNEIPEEEAQSLRARYRALGERMSARELAAVVACRGTFSFKNTLVGLRWSEVCQAKAGAHRRVPGWVELPPEALLTGALLGLGDTFWVRLRKVGRGEVEVILSANRWSTRHTVGVGQVVGRLGRSFRGRLVDLATLAPGAEQALVIAPAQTSDLPAEGESDD